VGNYGMTRGSEAGWSRFVAADPNAPLNAMNGGLGELIPLIFPAGDYDAATFDVERDGHFFSAHSLDHSQDEHLACAVGQPVDRRFQESAKLA
jgi:hypothetical protein